MHGSIAKKSQKNLKNNMLNRLEKWFELSLGWFFINGNKQGDWKRHIMEKYGKLNEKN